MPSKKCVEFLSKVPLFADIKKSSLKAIGDRMIKREFKAGELIIEQGKEGFGLFIVASGKAEARYETHDGTVSVVNTFTEGEYFGEMSLLDDEPRSASVVAVEDCTCLHLNRIDFVAILLKDAEMGLLIATELAKRLRHSLESK